MRGIGRRVTSLAMTACRIYLTFSLVATCQMILAAQQNVKSTEANAQAAVARIVAGRDELKSQIQVRGSPPLAYLTADARSRSN
jgi:hypothetical protein